MKTRLILVRHAEAEGNYTRRFHGWTDGEITEKGHKQAVRTAERLKEFNMDVLYSSSLRRTLQTAGYISEAKNLPIIRTDKLKEINGGDWENREFEELPVVWPEEYDTWENKPHLHRMPNGESMEEFQERLVGEIMYIIRNNEGSDICIVTHGTAIKALLCYFYGLRLEEIINIPWHDNTAITIIDYDEGRFNIVMAGDTSHIGRELSTFAGQDWWNEYMDKFEEFKDKFEEQKNTGSGLFTNWLFETGAVKVSPKDKPFWYTSGTIGPYYINTHFLYGSEEKANALLQKIDSLKDKPMDCPLEIEQETLKNYNSDKIYKGVIDEICKVVRGMADLAEIGFISGGERRDWFFSLAVANLLGKPHLTIYKDLSAVILENGAVSKAADLDGRKILHIADLVTEASSFSRAWIPAIEKLGANMRWSISVVDRKQGGAEFFESLGISFKALACIDRELFRQAMLSGIINKEQFEMISAYIKNPHEAMKEFLASNPGFMENALAAGGKTAERARLCIEKGIYG